MLILNAGLFPPGTRISELATGEWHKVMRVNLDANLALLREAHPLLKLAPNGGRVVVIGSKNVPAPARARPPTRPRRPRSSSWPASPPSNGPATASASTACTRMRCSIPPSGPTRC